MEAKDRIIFAADVGSLAELRDYLAKFGNEIGVVKVGMELLTHALLTGEPVYSTILKESPFKVMWDLKYCDIPSTVAGAAKEVAKYGQGRILGFTVHCLTGKRALQDAVQAVKDNFGEGLDAPMVIGVTLLTSLDSDDLKDLGIMGTSEEVVLRLAKLAIKEDVGVQAIVCSPKETRALLDLKSDLTVINPGIRFGELKRGLEVAESSMGTQKRVTTPRRAAGQGATYIVMGSDLRKGNPMANARRAAKEIEQGLAERIC